MTVCSDSSFVFQTCIVELVHDTLLLHVVSGRRQMSGRSHYMCLKKKKRAGTKN